MKRAALGVVLAACAANGTANGDFPPGGGGTIPMGGGGGSGDAGVGDGSAGDGGGGVSIRGRVCIVSDLRTPTVCDTTKSASGLVVSLGTRHPDQPPAATGEFTIAAPLGTDLVWQVTGTNFITTVMPYGTDNIIPIVPDTIYTELQSQNHVTILAEGEGSVVVRVVSGAAPASGVSATSTLVSGNVIPLYDADTSAVDWRELGPTQSHGVLWFPGVQVTSTAARITLTPPVGVSVTLAVNVVDQAITFLTQDVQ